MAQEGILLTNLPVLKIVPRIYLRYREALRDGTASDGLDTDRTIFESAMRTLAEGNTLCATARIVLVDADAAVGVAGC